MTVEKLLDDFTKPYQTENQFYRENLVIQKWYAEKVNVVVRQNKYQRILSLGLGNTVVAKMIMGRLSAELEHYAIVEGAKSILDSFSQEHNLPQNVSLHSSLFENFMPQEQFDCIEMGLVLEHVAEPVKLLRQYAGFLREQGRLIIAVPNATSLHRQAGYEAGLLDNLYRLSKDDLESGHVRYYDLALLSEQIMAAGLKIVNLEGIFLKPISTGQMEKLEMAPEILNAFCKLGARYPELSNILYVEAML